MPAAAYMPAERLKAMDAAGVDYSVLYPTVAGLAGEVFGRLEDTELELACVQAYNDWLIEDWAAASERFIPQCIVPIWPVEATVKEIRRAVARGHRGVVFPRCRCTCATCRMSADPSTTRSGRRARNSVCRFASTRAPLAELQYAPWSGLNASAGRGARRSDTAGFQCVRPLALLLLASAAAPSTLRVVLAESALSWGMLYMEWADHQFEHDGLAREGYDLKPSEMFHRSAF